MAVMDIAVEAGTSFTTIYLSGAGVVLREPSVVAFVGDDDKKKVLAAGYKAVAMQGSAPEKTRVVCPIIDGYIEDSEACVKMLAEFIKRILPSYIIFPKIRALIAVPTGLTVGERKTYEDVFREAGAAETTLIDDVMVSALGFDLPVDEPCGGLIANIGGGVTEIALISLCGTVSGCSVNVGGNMMDNALVDFVIGKYGLKIGARTARRVKEDIGSLYPNDVSSMEVRGINTNTMTPASLSVYATDVYEALTPYYSRIAEAVEGILNLCPPELAARVHGSGLYVCGGGAKILGLQRLLKELLGVPVTIAEDPEYTSISGAGRLIGNKELIKKINAQL